MTAVPDLMVTLTTGTQVPWSVFKTWSVTKQNKNLAPKPVLSEQGRARIIEANKNKKASAETRAKMSAALKGKPLNKPRSAETLAKIGAGVRAAALAKDLVADHTPKPAVSQ
jgi:hypothetical protein